MEWEDDCVRYQRESAGSSSRFSIITIDCVHIPIARDLLQEDPWLRRRVRELKRTKGLACSERCQAEIVLSTSRDRVARNLAIKIGGKRAAFRIVVVEELELYREPMHQRQ